VELGLGPAMDREGANDLEVVDAHGDAKRFIVRGDAYSERKSEHATVFSDVCSCLLTKEIRKAASLGFEPRLPLFA
jgi:hypothetical protein